MAIQEFIQKIKDILFATNQNFGPETVLTDLEGWDSLGRLSLAVMLHETFGAMLDTKTLLQLTTVGDIIELVQDKLKV